VNHIQDQIDDCLDDIEHERVTVRNMKNVMLTAADTKRAELAEIILLDAKQKTRDLETRLEALRSKLFENVS
jgi:hypothetical protein